MRRFIVTLVCGAAVLCARNAQAQPEGQPCIAEPTDQLIVYGAHIHPCEIGLVGDSDLFRFQGVAGEVVSVRVVDQAGGSSVPSCVLELLRPSGTVVTSVGHLNTCEIRTTLDASGLFTARVTESGNDQLMTYSVQLDRLAPTSPVATAVNPGDTITGAIIDPRGDADLFIFNGVNGDRISLRATDQAGGSSVPSCVLELYSPGGTLVTSVGHLNICVIETTLNQSGVFTARVTESGNDTVMTYNLEYQCLLGSCPSFQTLTVTRSGAGTVTSSPAGIDCGVDCSERFFAGTVVTLTAAPAQGWTFGGWSGDSDCVDGVVTMSAQRSCVATFSESNLPPTAVNDAFSTLPNTALMVAAPGVLANDNSNGGGAMTAVLVSTVSNGALALATNGGFTYTPSAGFAGVDSFVYRASNVHGPGNTATVTLTVTALPPPTAVNDAFNVQANGTLGVSAPGVLGNDNSNGSGAMTAVLATTTSNGSLALNVNGGFTYVPAFNFVGTDSFTYRASNAGGTSNIATVTITVAGPTSPQPPTDLVVDSVVNQLVTVRFTSPALGPSPTGFVLKGGLLPGQVLAALPTGSTAPIFTFLAPSGSFFIRVHTVAGGDESSASNEVSLHVNTPVPPSSPANLIGLVNGSSLALAWKNTYRGGPPSDLMLDVTGSATASFSLGVTDRFNFQTVPGGSYTFTVRAANAGGTSPSSNPVSLAFPGVCLGAPLMPTNFLAYKIGSTIFVLWDPAPSGPAPTSYVLDVAGSFVGTFPTAGRILSGSVGPGSYSLSVRATNACGSSPDTPVQVVSIP
jgi:hypothetical protein